MFNSWCWWRQEVAPGKALWAGEWRAVVLEFVCRQQSIMEDIWVSEEYLAKQAV